MSWTAYRWPSYSKDSARYGIRCKRASTNPARVSKPASRGRSRPCWVSRSRMLTEPSRTRTDSSANAGSGAETSNSSSISPTNCSRMSSTVITPALFEFVEEFGEDFGFGNDQDIVHDLADLGTRDARCQRLAEIDEAEAHPADEFLVIKDADDVFGATLRVVNRDTRVLPFDDAVEGFIEGEVGGQRKNIGTSDHDFADGDAVEFDGVVDHLFLRGGNLADLAAGGDDELEFVGGVDGAAAAGITGAEKPQDQASGAAHEKKYGACEGEERFHGSSHSQGDLLGALQGESLGDEFAEQDVEIGDEAEGDDDGDAVGVDGRVRNLMHKAQRTYQLGDHGFADPAQSQADDGDAELDAVDDFVEVLMQALDDTGAGAAGFNELLDAGVANTDQGELRGGEKRIRCHQEKDQEHAEQHKGDHLGVILMG